MFSQFSNMEKFSVVLVVLFVALFGYSSADVPVYKMCVPHHIYDACVELMLNPSDTVVIQCVPGRDRMDCLDIVNKRKADFLAVDPEDMYVAYHMSNQDFSVFSELRTIEEPEAEFRYEGIILVKKNSNIHSLNDLQGKKSCHTGYGRNVGYKIPLTKLKKHGVLKISNDPTLSPLDNELKGLSALFKSSCLVGAYSPDPEVNMVLKKRYPNLCALCEHPEICDYPDKYSGYGGAIKCLAENGGDVAFTKVIYVNKYFGLPVGNNPVTTKAEGNPDEYEYLCEDGSRKPVTGKACSWAQRPWQGYMGNADVNQKLKNLQKRIKTFYNDGKKFENKETALKMWIKDNQLVVDKEVPVLPGEHLIKAQYKDVIERDGNIAQKINICLSSDIEMKKCDVMKKAAYSRDIRPEFQCHLKTKSACFQSVEDGENDVVVVPASENKNAKTVGLKSILFESYSEDDVIVAIADNDVSSDLLKKSSLNFDSSDQRLVDSALYYNHLRRKPKCPKDLTSDENVKVKLVYAKDLGKYPNKKLVCKDFTLKSLDEYKTCNFDYTLPTAIFVKKTVNGKILDNIIHGFTSLSESFGHGGKIEDVFELFETFEDGAKDVIFSDRAEKFVTTDKKVNSVDESTYYQIRCY